MSEHQAFVGIVVGLAFVFVAMVMGYERKLAKARSETKNVFVSERELPSILVSAIQSYMEVDGKKSFQFRWSLETDGRTVLYHRCKACTKINKLDDRGTDGARCGGCGIPLKKAKEEPKSVGMTN